MEWLLRDLQSAARQISARPSLSLAVLGILAVGIGANTATFSLVHGLLLRPLPYPDSEAIVSVERLAPRGSARGRPSNVELLLSNADLWRLWDHAGSFEHLAAFSARSFVWDGLDRSINVLGTAATPSLFPLLRTTSQLGRLFTEADAVEGADRVVLLSHHAWEEWFASDPTIIGAPVELNDEPHIVIGVLPARFDFPRREVAIWQPLVVPPYEPSVGSDTLTINSFSTIGRLRPGASPEQAATEVRTILATPEPGRRPGSADPKGGIRVIPLREKQGRPYRPALLMLAAATALVLLMACANVAGLLLARGIVRQRELAVRGALGATRAQIIRQLLTESVVLSVAGGAVGLAVAAGIVRAAPVLVASNVPGLADVDLNGTALGFAAGLSLAAGLLIGFAPALTWSRGDLARILHEGGGSCIGGFGRLWTNRGQAGLAVVQVALALVLLMGAGLLLRSFTALVTLDLGFDPTNVVTANVQSRDAMLLFGRGGRRIGPERLADMAAANRRSVETLLRQLHRIVNLPGVQGVALASSSPLQPTGSMQPVHVAGQPPPGGLRDQLFAMVRTVSPGYDKVMRLRLRAGRFLTDRDTESSPRVAVVSESFARAVFGGEPAIGQRLAQAASSFRSPVRGEGATVRDTDPNEMWEVVGVVADVRFPLGSGSFTPGANAAGDIYLSMLQPGMDAFPSFAVPAVAVRTAGSPLAVVPFVREVLLEIEPGGVVSATSFETRLAARAAQPRFYAACAGIFGAVALLLGVFGLYSVLSYTVSQRRREIGVRMALGAGRTEVVMLVVRQGGTLVVAGIILGLSSAAMATRIVESVLFGVTSLDPLTFAAVTTMLLTVALIACWLPARRATRVDPVEALREG